MSPQKLRHGHARSRLGTHLAQLVSEAGSGAVEVWTCAVDGDMRFFDPVGELSSSRLVPDLPKHVKL